MLAERLEIINEVFNDIIENFAFMFGEAMEKVEVECSYEKYTAVKMSFNGHMSGSLLLSVPAEMRKEIAANVLGLDLDDEIVEKGSEDTLKEVLNVTCGHILTAIAGDEPVFDLTVPEISFLDSTEWKKILNDEETIAVLVDDYPALLKFELDE